VNSIDINGKCYVDCESGYNIYESTKCIKNNLYIKKSYDNLSINKYEFERLKNKL
jgi:hypothetical protein